MGGPGGWGKVVLPLITVCNSGLVVGSTTLLEVHMASFTELRWLKWLLLDPSL